MSRKNKLIKFQANSTFSCLYQPKTDEVLFKNYKYKGVWGTNVFGNNNPIIIELGCGKGEYTVEMARKYPDKNFIGIDIKGARLWRGAKTVTEENIPNAKFIRTKIEFINSLFSKDEISEIWITFADPQIKRERKRLTGSLFLNRYLNLINLDGVINLKTDSLYLYEYTKAIATQNGCRILCDIPDLYSLPEGEKHSMNLPESLTEIQTFYEKFFISRGFAIKYLSFMLSGVQQFHEPQWEELAWENKEMQGRDNLPVNKGNL